MKNENEAKIVYPLEGGILGPKRAQALKKFSLSKGDLAFDGVSPIQVVISELSREKTTIKLKKLKLQRKIQLTENYVIITAAQYRKRDFTESFPCQNGITGRKVERRKLRKEENEVFELFTKNGCKGLACKREALIENKNLALCNVFSQLVKYQSCDYGTSDLLRYAKTLAYERALAVLRSFPILITQENYRKLMHVHQFGEKCVDKVEEVLKTGTCQKLEKFKSNQKICSILSLVEVHGIGYKKALKSVEQGIINLDDLINKRKEVQLDEISMFCLDKLASNELRNWTIKEANEFLANLEKENADPEYKFFIAGGFSRGKTEGHDLDILVSFKSTFNAKEALNLGTGFEWVDTEQFEKLITAEMKELKAKQNNFVERLIKSHDIKILASGRTFSKSSTISTSSTVLLFVKFQGQWRRLDIVFVCPLVFPFAQLGWVGSKHFEKSLRLYTSTFKNELNEGNTELSFKLSSSSLALVNKFNDSEVKHLVVHEEKAIFDYLHLKYLKPVQRNH